MPTTSRRPATEPETDAERTARDSALRKAYSQAARLLRENHQDEFNTLYQAAAKELGVDWSPRLTPEQKAKEEMERLLAEFPHLRDTLFPVEDQDQEPDPDAT